MHSLCRKVLDSQRELSAVFVLVKLSSGYYQSAQCKHHQNHKWNCISCITGCWRIAQRNFRFRNFFTRYYYWFFRNLWCIQRNFRIINDFFRRFWWFWFFRWVWCIIAATRRWCVFFNIFVGKDILCS